MHPKDDEENAGVDYAWELAKAQGVSVTTVSDGWVFIFTSKMLKSLLEQAEAAGGTVVVQVQNSSTIPKSSQN